MLRGEPHQGKWRQVSAQSPCPICGKPDWCSLSTDGFIAACRRIELGAIRSKLDRSCVPIYIHHLSTSPRADFTPLKPLSAHVERAEADTLDRVYNALLTRLFLSKSHRASLRGRGLSDESIDRNGYKTLPVQGRARIARELRDRFGAKLLQVPGFVVKEDQGASYFTIAGAAGLIIPCRDLAGRVIAFKVRRDSTSAGPKYVYSSSVNYSGPGPGSPVHIPLGIIGPVETVRLTEGELKADVCMCLSGLPTISAPGAASWRACLSALKQLRAPTVRLAFDADVADNSHVARALLACAEALPREGFAVELERWNKADGKGLDDLLAAGKVPELVKGTAVLEVIQGIAAAAGVLESGPAKLVGWTRTKRGLRFTMML